MGKIKKILENELIGGTQQTDVYPITSTKAIYDENNERLDNVLEKKFDKVSVVQESGEAEDKVMSQKAVSDAIAVEKTRAKEAEENLDNKVTDLDEELNGAQPVVTTENIPFENKGAYSNYLFSKPIPAGYIITEVKIRSFTSYPVRSDGSFDSSIQFNTLTLPYTTTEEYIGFRANPSFEGTFLLTYNNGVEPTDGLIEKVNKITETLNNKVDKIEGLGLSSNDYTDADKEVVSQLSDSKTDEDVQIIKTLKNRRITFSGGLIGIASTPHDGLNIAIFEVPVGVECALKVALMSNKYSSVYGFADSADIGPASPLIIPDEPHNGACTNYSVIFVSAHKYVYVCYTASANVPILTYKKVTEGLISKVEKIKQEVDEIKPHFIPTIPTNVYAVVGVELNLWNDAISLPIDKGLSSPTNYKCEWLTDCNGAVVIERGLRITPTKVGTFPATCNIYDMNYKLCGSKNFNIVVSAYSGLSSAKNILYLGDSLNSSGQTTCKIASMFNKVGGVAPNFVGSVESTSDGTTTKHEAHGGWALSSFATSGFYIANVPVSGVSSVGVNAMYADSNNKRFIVSEVNINDGAGNISVYRASGNTSDIVPSGILTKVSGSGDDTITYSGATRNPSNPLWNYSTSSIDIAKYRNDIGLNEKIDAVCIQLFVNGSFGEVDLSVNDVQIKALYDAFVADNPSCKVIIGLGAMSGNTANGSGANYGASRDISKYIHNVYKIRKHIIETFEDNPQYANLKVVVTAQFIDRYYGYTLSPSQISSRYTTNENVHINYVHPTDSGYWQMADGWFCNLIKLLNS